MNQYSWWDGDNPPPPYLKTVKQLEKLGLYPKKAEAVIYLKKGKPVYLFNPRSADSVMLAETFKAKHQSDRAIASSWARDLLTRDFLILDTETTGLKKPEICQIAITDNQGNALLNTLVKPTKSIEAKAQQVHGISNTDVVYNPEKETWNRLHCHADKITCTCGDWENQKRLLPSACCKHTYKVLEILGFGSLRGYLNSRQAA